MRYGHKHLFYCTLTLGTDKSCIQCYDSVLVLQLAAQVLDEFEDEDIGVGLIDAKHDKAVAKKLGKHQNNRINTPADCLELHYAK